MSEKRKKEKDLVVLLFINITLILPWECLLCKKTNSVSAPIQIRHMNSRFLISMFSMNAHYPAVISWEIIRWARHRPENLSTIYISYASCKLGSACNLCYQDVNISCLYLQVFFWLDPSWSFIFANSIKCACVNDRPYSASFSAGPVSTGGSLLLCLPDVWRWDVN